MATSVSEVATSILNCLLDATRDVLPVPISRGRPVLFSGSVIQQEMSVLLGLTGTAAGRIILMGRVAQFGKIAEQMYGVKLHGDMLESFAGEFGNMVCGTLCSRLAEVDIHLEISPPTVLVGEARITGFATAIRLPLEVQDIGPIETVLALSNGDAM